VILALVFRLLKVKEPLFLKEPILIINKTCSTLEKKLHDRPSLYNDIHYHIGAYIYCSHILESNIGTP